jgi:catechol 2,3-dioxygenase-like lactoylglutathione lyase family enzyme
MSRGQLHHIELWVPSIGRSIESIGWLLEEMGYDLFQSFENGRSWRLGQTYIVVEQSPAMTSSTHDRLLPGLNHLAFHAGSKEEVDELVEMAIKNGWSLLFPEKHPHAGGAQHYAAYLANSDGFEVELVAQ